MSNAYRTNRKATDADILKLNSVGISLGTIARILGVHPTTVTLRLKSLNVAPSDTRRTFCEDVFTQLNTDEQEWLVDLFQDGNISIKTFVHQLIVQEHARSKEKK